MKVKDQELFQRAKKFYEEGQTQKAIQLLRKLHEDYPKNEDILYLLGNSFYFSGQVKSAQLAYKMVLEINPEHTDASIGLSILLNDTGRYDQAKTVFDTARLRVKRQNSTLGPQDKHIDKQLSLRHYELGETYLAYERYDEAIREFQKAIQLDENYYYARLKMAKAMAKKGFIAKAIEELKRLKNEHPDFQEARTALGILYFGQGHVIEAQTEWQKVLEKNPNNSEAQMYLNLSFSASETQI